MASNMFDPSPMQGIHCQGCEHLLPLRMSGPAEVATLWECSRCSTAFAGVLLPEQAASLAKFVRLAQLHFDAEHAEPLPANFRANVLTQVSNQTDREVVERRRSPRDAIQLDAVAIGLDANYMLVGPTCHGLVVNLSSHGMLLTTPVILPAACVAVQMQAGSEKMQLLGKIVWSRHLGDSCYGAGIDFVARLGKVPANPANSPLTAARADHSAD
jgi:PilZ domain